MKLYEIDEQIMNILSLLEPDAETGEIPSNYEELDKRLQELQMQRFDKLKGVAKYILNIRSESSALQTEEKRLSDRRKVLENKEKHLLEYLDNACGGQKTDLGIATLSYRKSEHVEITDYHQAIRFLADNHHSDCFRTYDPEIAKAEVKALIKSGTEVPGIEIVAGVSCSLR